MGKGSESLIIKVNAKQLLIWLIINRYTLRVKLTKHNGFLKGNLKLPEYI